MSNLLAGMRTNLLSEKVHELPGQVRRFPEKLSLFSEWTGYAFGLIAVLSLALTVLAAASGFVGWAMVAGALGVLAIVAGSSIVSGAVHHDHRVHQHTPRFPLPGGDRWPVR